MLTLPDSESDSRLFVQNPFTTENYTVVDIHLSHPVVKQCENTVNLFTYQ